MRWGLAAFALVLALAALAFAGAYYVSQPTTFRVAVSTSDSQSRALMEAAAGILDGTKASVRLRVTASDGPLAALEKGETDFAVARSVEIMKAQAQTVLVLRQDAAVIMVPKPSKISTLPDLVSANIGVVRESYMNGGGLAAVMGYYGVDITKLKLTPLAANEVAAAVRDKKVNALVIAGNLRAKSTAEAVADAARSFKGGARFLDIEAADAIAKRVPDIESIEVDKGLFGGYPPLPDDSVNTVGVSVRLVADARLANDRVSDFLSAIAMIKQQLIARVSGAGGLAIPDPDDESAFVLHQGVRTYNKGEVVGLLDKYSDQIYVGGLLASALGSLFAGAFSMIENRRRRKSIGEVMEIERVLEAVEGARSEAELAGLAERADEVFRATLHKAMEGKIEPATIAAFEMAYRDLRERIAAKRAGGLEKPGPALVAAR